MGEIKQKRCQSCKEIFTPVRRGLSVSKTCSPGCDKAQPKKEKKKKKKEKTAAQLKKDLWSVFSLHQKLVYSTDGEWCQCYTCDKPLRIGESDTHGGHCLSKAANPNLYFDERAVRVQCLRCNVHHGGMHYEFNERLKKEIGMQAWQDMYDNRRLVVKKNSEWYKGKIKYYTEQARLIKQEKSGNILQ